MYILPSVYMFFLSCLSFPFIPLTYNNVVYFLSLHSFPILDISYNIVVYFHYCYILPFLDVPYIIVCSLHYWVLLTLLSEYSIIGIGLHNCSIFPFMLFIYIIGDIFLFCYWLGIPCILVYLYACILASSLTSILHYLYACIHVNSGYRIIRIFCTFNHGDFPVVYQFYHFLPAEHSTLAY